MSWRQVFANAVILTELGFIQHNPKKPWLFRYPIHRKQGMWLYADLGESDIVPIYKDTAAMVYAFGRPLFDDDDSHGDNNEHASCCTGTRISNYLVREGGERLHRDGVDIRFGFEATRCRIRQSANASQGCGSSSRLSDVGRLSSGRCPARTMVPTKRK